MSPTRSEVFGVHCWERKKGAHFSWISFSCCLGSGFGFLSCSSWECVGQNVQHLSFVSWEKKPIQNNTLWRETWAPLTRVNDVKSVQQQRLEIRDTDMWRCSVCGGWNPPGLAQWFEHERGRWTMQRWTDINVWVAASLLHYHTWEEADAFFCLLRGEVS